MTDEPTFYRYLQVTWAPWHVRADNFEAAYIDRFYALAMFDTDMTVDYTDNDKEITQ